LWAGGGVQACPIQAPDGRATFCGRSPAHLGTSLTHTPSHHPCTRACVRACMQVCDKLLDLLPMRMCVVPLLPVPDSHTSLVLHFCHQDIAGQLRVGAAWGLGGCWRFRPGSAMFEPHFLYGRRCLSGSSTLAAQLECGRPAPAPPPPPHTHPADARRPAAGQGVRRAAPRLRGRGAGGRGAAGGG
jgi:hypothetical protein